LAKVARIHPTKKGTWTDIRAEFVRVQELASATPRLWYQEGRRRRWRPVRGNMLFEYRSFKRLSGGVRASQLRSYLRRCLISTKVLAVELIWPDNQEVNGKVLVRKMRSTLGSASARKVSSGARP
jgi:hypothetical protein